MDASGYGLPDIASVLRTLAAYAPPAQSGTFPAQDNISISSTNQEIRIPPDVEEGEYDPNGLLTLVQTPSRPIVPPAAETSIPTAHNVRKPTGDSQTITTWPSALRHVTRLLAREQAVSVRISKLIKVQQQHEQQWWDGREVLLKKQKDRADGKQKIDDVLRAVGGKIDSTVGGPTPEDDVAELNRYDRKVHRACGEMIKATKAELTSLGIPFFAIQQSLITTSENRNGTQEELDSLDRSDEVPPKLREEDLLALQKRMLELLEDLCHE